MQLRLGKMSSKEIADWFGIKEGSYRNKKKEKLEELKNFCDYKVIHGGVDIKHIKHPRYMSNLDMKDRQTLLYYQGVSNNVVSNQQVSRKIKKDKVEEYKSLELETIAKRMGKQMNVLYGAVGRKGKYSQGEIGYRIKKMFIKESSYNYRQMTQEEHNLLCKITGKYCSDNPEEVLDWMALEDQFLNTDMTKEEYKIQKEYIGKGVFTHILYDFAAITGFWLTRVNICHANGMLMSEMDKEAIQKGIDAREKAVS